MYRIHQIKLEINEPKENIPQKIIRKTGLTGAEITDWKIVRESLDSRDKSRIMWVYSVDFNIRYAGTEEKSLPAKVVKRLEAAGVSHVKKYEYKVPCPDLGTYDPQKNGRPVVVGFGPCGIFCALILAQAGLRPVVIERGRDSRNRTEDVERFWNEGILDCESNVQFGEGGAGAFSDGKLTTGIKDMRIGKVLNELVLHGAPEEILYKQKPHIGTDLLKGVVRNIRKEIIRLGGTVLFDTKLTGFISENGRISGIEVTRRPRATGVPYNAGDPACAADHADAGDPAEAREQLHLRDTSYQIKCSQVVLAPGHSARDTFELLRDAGIAMEQKPFSIGVRIEHSQDIIDRAQYGKTARELGLPPAEYKVSFRCKEGPAAGRGVYSFCMCPGGQVILASSEAEGTVVNGMSLHARDSGKANSALLCDVRTEDFGSDDVLAGVRLQQYYEHLAWRNSGSRRSQTTEAEMSGKPSALPEKKPAAAPACTWGAFRDGMAPQVEGCLPEFAVAALRQAVPEFGKKLRGFDNEDAKMYAVETRSSSPVRILRGKDRQSLTLRGLYPAGEGAGYAGGITSAAVDGIRTAEAVISQMGDLTK